MLKPSDAGRSPIVDHNGLRNIPQCWSSYAFHPILGISAALHDPSVWLPSSPIHPHSPFKSPLCRLLTSQCFFSQVTTLPHGKYYALKRISKKHVVAKRQEDHVKFEKQILQDIHSDFIVRYLIASYDRVEQCVPIWSLGTHRQSTLWLGSWEGAKTLWVRENRFGTHWSRDIIHPRGQFLFSPIPSCTVIQA